MPNYILRDVPPDLWAAVRARAERDGEPLKAVLLELLQQYVDGSMQSRGGHARAAKMTAGERSAAARHAANRRWSE